MPLSGCSQLIGKPYVYGTNGETVDCIALVIQALDLMGINNPGVKADWYEMSMREVIRELDRYTERIAEPAYDGDIVVIAGSPPAFGVAWQSGILFINRQSMRVDWKPASLLLIRAASVRKRPDRDSRL